MQKKLDLKNLVERVHLNNKFVKSKMEEKDELKAKHNAARRKFEQTEKKTELLLNRISDVKAKKSHSALDLNYLEKAKSKLVKRIERRKKYIKKNKKLLSQLRGENSELRSINSDLKAHVKIAWDSNRRQRELEAQRRAEKFDEAMVGADDTDND